MTIKALKRKTVTLYHVKALIGGEWCKVATLPTLSAASSLSARLDMGDLRIGRSLLKIKISAPRISTH
tara:strand:- start:392 stop:595 length:204 start_codon:yes stop_codon:yes gene_type:complete